MKKYFYDENEYPSEIIMDSSEMLESGVLYSYIASTFLNGLINYVKPIKVFIIDRYESPQTKLDIIKKIETGEINTFHTKLHIFCDDVLFLGKTENYYWLFWFDCDVSDCLIGRFTTSDSEEEIIENFTDYCKEIVTMYSDDADNTIHEFKKEWIQGWVEF